MDEGRQRVTGIITAKRIGVIPDEMLLGFPDVGVVYEMIHKISGTGILGQQRNRFS